MVERSDRTEERGEVREFAPVVRAVADMAQVQDHWSEMMLAVAVGDRERYVAARLRWRAAELALFADTFGPAIDEQPNARALLAAAHASRRGGWRRQRAAPSGD